MLYFNQSIYIHSHIETPHGVRRLGGGGIWQFRPETMELEVFIRGLVNPWGHHIDRWGQSFATDGAGGEGINYCLPGAYYTTAPDAVRILKGLNPGSPKYCGLEVASGRHLPEAWQGNLLTNDFRGNRVCRFIVSDDGAGFAVARAGRADQDPARRLPADRRQDGARRRDLHRRLVQPDHPARRGRFPRPPARPHPRPDLARHGQGPAARRSSQARRRDSCRSCSTRSRRPRTGPGSRPSACSRSGAPARSCRPWRPGSAGSTQPIPSSSIIDSKRSGPIRRSTSSSPSCSVRCSTRAIPRVRAAATRVVRHWHRRLPDPLALLAAARRGRRPARPARGGASPGPDPQPSRRPRLALRALDRPVDLFLDYALWLTARELQSRLASRGAGRAGSTSAAIRGTWSSRSRRSARPRCSSRCSPCSGPAACRPDRDESVQTMIASLGGPAELALVLELAETQGPLPSSRRAALLGALIRATQQRKVVPAGDLTRLGRLIEPRDDAAEPPRDPGGRALEGLGPPAHADRAGEVRRSVGPDPAGRPSMRSIQLGDPAGRQVVVSLAERGATPDVQALALASLAGEDPKTAAPPTAAWLSRLAAEQGAVAAAGPVAVPRAARRPGPAGSGACRR